ncbi:hypothetical protein LX73_1923 [Fodinibius salinus]|uniref:Uncharacterized protein n=1 Tax=Fodinibius salinus TaxID=860790 RepID=A0A5D3YGK7_9BACT|nr:hypothetical protein [Fodinibius salinus]TYP92561.1 hypothetical protein LX73_1923 [Fodinibius salinus]
MNFEAFAAKWFVIYYSIVGLCLIGGGSYLSLKKEKMKSFILDAAESEKPPRLFIRILKYFFFFTLPGLVLSFTPFSWVELLFTLWSLLLVYVAGIQLVQWEQRRQLIKTNDQKLSSIIRRWGSSAVAVGLAILLLAYFTITRFPA